MESRDLEDGKRCFISNDGEVAIIIDEEKGEQIRIEGENMRFGEVVED